MSVINSLFSAFAMYSRIPVPQVEWKEENRRYSLCFFPLIGAVIGGLEYGLFYLARSFDIGDLIYAVTAVLIPVLVTGGIHLDGFCDVTDARESFAPKEKALEIMKDSRVGAFAVIYLVLYFLVQTALFYEMKADLSVYTLLEIIVIAMGFVESRALSALAAATFPSATGSSSLQNFVDPKHKNVTVAVQIVYLLVCAVVMMMTGGIFGGLLPFLMGIAAFVYYKISCKKRFGGITGDMAGWFLQICELCILAGTYISTLILRKIMYVNLLNMR